MKGYHFILLFLLIYFAVSMHLDIKQAELTAVLDQKFQIDDAYQAAVDAGTKLLTKSLGQKPNKEAVAEQFFNALSAALGILDDRHQQEMLRLYVPVMAVVAEDGFYVLHNVLHAEGFVKQWTECIPYVYEDSNFLYRFTLSDNVYILDKEGLLDAENSLYFMTYQEAGVLLAKKGRDSIFLDEETYQSIKRSSIISTIEKHLTYYVNQNNFIAEHYEIQYQFLFPEVDESEWMRSINGTSLLVVFQGYPYDNGKYYYNQFAAAGAEVRRTEAYYVISEEYYYTYHMQGCPLLNGRKDYRTAYSRKECVKEGAFPCTECIK